MFCLYLYILEFYKFINVFTWKTNIFFTEKILFIKYISCYIIRILPKQNIIFDNEKWLFLLRNCLMLTGVAFWGNILMMDDKSLVLSESSFAAHEQPHSSNIMIRKNWRKKMCVKCEQSLFIFNYKAKGESPLFINFLKNLISNRWRMNFLIRSTKFDSMCKHTYLQIWFEGDLITQ